MYSSSFFVSREEERKVHEIIMKKEFVISKVCHGQYVFLCKILYVWVCRLTKKRISRRFKEYESLEMLCKSKAAAKATGLKSRLVSVCSESRPHTYPICQLKKDDCILGQAAHKYFSHSSSYRDSLLFSVVKLEMQPESRRYSSWRMQMYNRTLDKM